MKRRTSFILLTTILLIAASLRLYRIADYMTFLGDEGRDVLVVYNILHGHLTLLGPTSSVGGFFLGPIYYYFMAPFLLLFNYNPVGPAVMVALFGIVTVWFVYKIGTEFFDESTGLIASFLYAISPVVVIYSHSSWNPNLMPIFTIMTLYTIYKAAEKNSGKLFLLGGLFLGVLIQLHYLATFVGLIIIVYLLFIKILLKQDLQWTWLNILTKSISENFFIFIGFVIGFSPFLAFEARHGFPNIMSIFKFVFHSSDVNGSGNYTSIIQDVFFRLFGRLVTAFPPPAQVSLQAHPALFGLYIFTWALGILSFLYFIMQCVQEFRFRDKKFLQIALLFVWFIVGILLFGFYKKQIYDYYFEFLFPLPFLIVGLFLSYLWYQKKIVLSFLAAAIFLFLIFINLQSEPFQHPPNRQLNQLETISRFVLDKSGGKPYNFALITGGNSDHAYRYFFTIWHHPPVTILNTSDDPLRKSVTDQLLVVCETLPCAPLGNSLWEVAGFGRADIAGTWNVSVVQVMMLVHYPLP